MEGGGLVKVNSMKKERRAYCGNDLGKKDSYHCNSQVFPRLHLIALSIAILGKQSLGQENKLRCSTLWDLTGQRNY